LTPWDLNAVVLCHLQRYFSAVTAVIQGWEDVGNRELGQLTSLLGNVAWARSGFVTDSRAEEEAMAWTGALAGALGDRLADLAGDRRHEALALVCAEERRVREHFDLIVEALAAELGDRSPTPGELNRWVWRRLFPSYPWECGVAELQEAIRRRLEAALGP